MTPQQIVGLAVRLFAIWLIFAALQMVGSGISVSNQAGLEPTYGFFVWAALMFLLALALWFFPLVVAHRLIPRTRFEDVLRVPATQAAMVACVILGLWLFTSRVLPGLAYYVSLALAMRANNQPLGASDEFTIVRLGTVAIELSVAGALCFKAHAISRFFTIERAPAEED